MSALTLLLVVGLCNAETPRICSYMDVTQRMQVTTDTECYDLAIQANQHNIEIGDTPRYDCVLPAKFLTLVGEKPTQEPAKAGKPGRVL
jgi:hypothetical protein